MSEEEVQRVEDLTLQRALDTMSDLIYCPRCQAPALEDNDHCTQCPKCVPFLQSHTCVSMHAALFPKN